MHLKIITHEKVVFDEDVTEIYTRGVDGEFGILKDHVPVMAALDIGVTKVIQNGQPKSFTTMGGVLQFKNDDAIILTTTAEPGSEIDTVRAQEALKRAQLRLSENNAQVDVKRAQAAISRAMVRLKASLNK
ncbi:MAG: ATP synthase F1 subunit epsilon [Clostridiaceae bacterium]|jgi:F-type H+-transporting ATPase subunit epsilon|nr:ATP synthase F1 subunit epsilon [Clostridiaceae bacterium]